MPEPVEDWPRACHGPRMTNLVLSSPAWRIVVAFAVASTVAAFVLAGLYTVQGGIPSVTSTVLRTTLALCLYGAWPATLLLAVPTYLVLRRRVRPTLLNGMVTGAILAALLSSAPGPFMRPSDAWVGGREVILDGQTTVWGWIARAKLMASIVIAGAVGGAIFGIAAAGTSAGTSAKSG